MCGIVGCNFYSQNFYKSIELLSHRGPDNLGYYEYHNNYFGHTRLSIIDLNDEANQPMVFDDIIITFNGEIYNYKKLIKQESLSCITKSDTEVIIRLYQKYDISFLNLLEGMFSFCIYDKRKKRYFAARDKFGEKPFYYYFKNNKFIYASEIKSILKLLDYKPEVNKEALYEYMSYNTPINGNTFYKDIFKLDSSSYLLLEEDLKIQQYFSLENIETCFYDEKTILNDLENLLFSSIEKRLVSDVNVGTFLSGGIDSSFISSIYTRITNNKINTFSLGFKEFNEYNELPYAKQVSNYINSNHNEILVSRNDFIENIDNMLLYTDEPFADTASIPTFILSNFVRKQGIKAVLSGEGGDECFLGYGLYKKALQYPTISELGDWNLTKEWEYNNRALNHQRVYQSYGECFTEYQKKELFKTYKIKNRLKEYENSYEDIKWMPYIDFRIWISDVLMTKVDRMSMANSLEVRAPFLDSNLVEYLFKVDSKIKKGEYSKYLLKQISQKYLPKDIVFREKKGFSSPFIEWVLDFYKNKCLDIILETNASLNLFNEDFIKFLFNEAKNKRFKQHFWNLFIFAKWFKENY